MYRHPPPVGLIPVNMAGVLTLYYPLDWLLQEQEDLRERHDPEAKRAADAITASIVEAQSAAFRCPN